MTCQDCTRDKTVALIDGSQVCTYCEQYRHECEAKAILHFPTLSARRHQLALVEKMRGEAERLRLQKTMMALFKRGRQNETSGT